jgi:hypothetical protein
MCRAYKTTTAISDEAMAMVNIAANIVLLAIIITAGNPILLRYMEVNKIN